MRRTAGATAARGPAPPSTAHFTNRPRKHAISQNALELIRPESISKFGFDEYCLWHFIGKGRAYWDPEIWQNGRKMEGLAGKYGPDVHVDFMLDFIERNREKPFFAYLTTNLPHEPYGPTPHRPDGPGGGKAQADDPDARARKEALPKDGKDYGDPKYFPEMVAYLDKLVGRVVKKLEDLDLRNDTILLFYGDIGSGYGTKTKIDGVEIPGGKASTTVYGTHVPLIVDWPASGAKGVVCDDLMDCSDYVPTLMEAAGAILPPDLVVDGRSFLPAVRGEKGILGSGPFPTTSWAGADRHASGSWTNVGSSTAPESSTTTSPTRGRNNQSAEAEKARRRGKNSNSFWTG